MSGRRAPREKSMTKLEIERPARHPFKARYGNFIGGEWREPQGGQYFDNTSPVNGQLLCAVARSDARDIDAAIDEAHRAKAAWGGTSVAERARRLEQIARVMEDNLELLAQAETWDNGKPIRETRAA